MFELTEKQREAQDILAGPARHILGKGGARSGKTFLLIRSIFFRALRVSKSRHVALRFRANASRSSLWLDTIPAVRAKCFPGLPLQYHERDGYISFPNNSQLWVGGLDDKDRVEKILGQEYCVSPDARILTADLRWERAASIKVGDELIAFPEDLDGHMQLVRSTVTRAGTIQAKRYRISTSRGETVVSAEHKFVEYRDDRRTKNFRFLSWTPAEDLKCGDKIRFACGPWEVGTSYDDGWIGGALDGEGWIGGGICGFAQNSGPVLARMGTLLKERGVNFREHKQFSGGDTCHRLVPDSIWDSLRLLGIARPLRLIPRASRLWENRRGFMGRGAPSGHRGGNRASENGRHVATVTSIEEIGEGPVMSFETTSRTLIADGFLGHNCTIYLNECSQIRWSTVPIVLTRLAQKCPGIKNRAYYDLNPVGKTHWTYKLFTQHVSPDTGKSIPDPENYAQFRINPVDNRPNIDPELIASLEGLPERQRLRFLEGQDQEDGEGQLWTLEMLAQCRVEAADVPTLKRIVVAVDPSGDTGLLESKHDAIGISVSGLGTDGHVYILEDATGSYSPEAWGKKVVELYRKHKADCVLGEANFGGDMVRAVVHGVVLADGYSGRNCKYKPVTASRGKVVRAEPVASRYEQGLVHHAGEFAELENELQNFRQGEYMGERSPNAADAAIWGVTEFLDGPAFGLLELWKTQAADVDKIISRVHVPSAPDTKELADAQKRDIDKMQAPKKLGKVATAPQQTDICPNCGNRFLSKFSESWRCGACGATGKNDEKDQSEAIRQV